MDRHDRLGVLGDPSFHVVGIELIGLRIQIGQHRQRPGGQDGSDRAGIGIGRGDDLVARPDAEAPPPTCAAPAFPSRWPRRTSSRSVRQTSFRGWERYRTRIESGTRSRSWWSSPPSSPRSRPSRASAANSCSFGRVHHQFQCAGFVGIGRDTPRGNCSYCACGCGSQKLSSGENLLVHFQYLFVL